MDSDDEYEFIRAALCKLNWAFYQRAQMDGSGVTNFEVVFEGEIGPACIPKNKLLLKACDHFKHMHPDFAVDCAADRACNWWVVSVSHCA